MRVEIEVRVSGKRGRMTIWTIERDADLAAGKGIGLELEEAKGILERLQAIVATEHAVGRGSEHGSTFASDAEGCQCGAGVSDGS